MALGIASGVCLATGTPGALLLLVQAVKLAAEVVKVLARFGKAVDLQELEPEPFGLFGLLYKQLGGAGRVHVHLPFLDTTGAAVCWAGAVWPGLVPDVSRWPRRRQDPQNRSPRPPLGGTGELFLAKISGRFLAKMEKAGIFAARLPPEFPVNFFQPWGGL